MTDLLRRQILKKFSNPINSPKDCNILAIEISELTGRSISEATLRRFFGLLFSKSSLSKYNLDTLCIYCGYKNSNEFKIENIEERKSNNSISKVKNDLQSISDYTIKNIQKKSLTRFVQTIQRTEINHKLNHFLQSKNILLPFIAPGGYGKSIALNHWIKELDRDKHFCLFCSAEIFHKLISNQLNTGQNLNLQLERRNNLFEQILNENNKLVLVIDAIDDIATESNKLTEIASYISNVLNIYSTSLNLKIIISARNVTWNINISPYLKLNSKNIIENIPVFNIPNLTTNEVESIIEKNSQLESKKKNYPCLSWYIKEIIKIPINLHYFISIYNEGSNYENISRNSLYRKYLSKQIFKSKHAEQKEDVLWEILRLIEENTVEFKISKSVLKTKYPIHLKRETEYYKAYHELQLDDILIEEREENKFGIFTTSVKFKHQDFYYYLTALNHIRLNGGVDSQIFLKIVNTNKSVEWKAFIIAIIYEMAYYNEDYDSIKDFCLLPVHLLSTLEVRHSVGSSFRTNNKIRNKTIKQFASIPNGQTYFFEQYVDVNYIVNNYDYRIAQYLKNKKTKESLLFGNSMVFLSGFLQLDISKCTESFAIIGNIEPIKSIHPWPIGRKVASHIMYESFITGTTTLNSKDAILHYRKIAYDYADYLKIGMIEFELPIIQALCLIKEYAILLDILIEINKTYKFDVVKDSLDDIMFSNQNALPLVFLEYSRYKLGKAYNVNLPLLLKQAINSYYSNMDDFQYRILLQWFLCDFYYQNGQLKEALEYWELAFELSKYAGYKFFMAFLLSNHPQKNEREIQMAKNLIKDTGFIKGQFEGHLGL